MPRRAARLLALCVAAVAVVGATPGTGAAQDAGPAGRVPPRPVEVQAIPADELDALPDGLSIAPGIVTATAAVGEASQPSVVVSNASDRPLDLRVRVVPVRAGEGGKPETVGTGAGDGAGEEVARGAAAWVRLAADRLHLDPHERAFVWPTVTATTPTPDRIAALVIGNADVEVQSYVIPGPPAREAPTVTTRLDDAGSGRVVVRMLLEAAGERPVVATGRVRVASWYGSTVAEATVPPTIVLPGSPRTQVVTFAAPVLPGPHTATAELEVADQVVSASDRRWLQPSRVVSAGVAGGLLVLTVALLVVVYRRRRGRDVRRRGA